MPSQVQTTQTNQIQTEIFQPAEPRFANCWTIFYRHGVNAVLTKNFYHNGNMSAARDRAMKHCGIMGYKFNYIRPLLCDIETEEGIQLGTIDPRTGLPKVVQQEGAA